MNKSEQSLILNNSKNIFYFHPHGIVLKCEQNLIQIQFCTSTERIQVFLETTRMNELNFFCDWKTFFGVQKGSFYSKDCKICKSHGLNEVQIMREDDFVFMARYFQY
jgi:hypothetical protein